MIKRITGQPLIAGEIDLPGDKSIAHRAVMLNAIAEGRARIANFCGGGDCLSTISCFRALGVKVVRTRAAPDVIEVHGVGARGLEEPQNVLNARNSGTTMRLISGLLAGQRFLSVITGDASLRSRPMGRIIEPLRKMGADISGRGGGRFAPLVVRGGGLRGMDYELPVASAQVKSSLILAGLFAEGETIIHEPAPTRDHTERMLVQMGAPLKKVGPRVAVPHLHQPLKALSLEVPGDISAAAYWLVAGAIHRRATLKVTNCGVNPTRTGILDILRAMGAELKVIPREPAGGEPVADIVAESSLLRATEISGDMVVRAIDEIPVLAVTACLADGDTVIRGAGELRVKETDRIAHTVRELTKMGARIEELPDGMVVHGVGRLRGAEVDSHGDHRLAMSLAVAGLVADGETVVKGAEAASISYPAFWNDLEKIVSRSPVKGVK